MSTREHSPGLHVAAARARLEAENAKIANPNEPVIEYYVEGQPGFYFARSPRGKLYLDEIPGDQYFGNTDARLADLAPRIVGVVIRWRGGTRAFGTLSEFVAWAFPALGSQP